MTRSIKSGRKLIPKNCLISKEEGSLCMFNTQVAFTFEVQVLKHRRTLHPPFYPTHCWFHSTEQFSNDYRKKFRVWDCYAQ